MEAVRRGGYVESSQLVELMGSTVHGRRGFPKEQTSADCELCYGNHYRRQLPAGPGPVTIHASAFDLPMHVKSGRAGAFSYQYTVSGERFRETDSLAMVVVKFEHEGEKAGRKDQ